MWSHSPRKGALGKFGKLWVCTELEVSQESTTERHHRTQYCYFVILHYRQYYFYLCWCPITQIKTHCPKPTVFSLKMHQCSVLFLLSSKSWLKQHFICTRNLQWSLSRLKSRPLWHLALRNWPQAGSYTIFWVDLMERKKIFTTP